MYEKAIDPHYEIISSGSEIYIDGTENTSGDKIRIKIPGGEAFARELAELLSDKKVSVIHAREIIRDKLLSYIEQDF